MAASEAPAEPESAAYELADGVVAIDSGTPTPPHRQGVITMRNILAITLVLVLAFSLLTACVSKPANNQAGTTSADSAGTVYKITDYYKDDGSFSALGLALDEENSEKVLTVKTGDTIVLSNREYEVTDESITLSFYTQPSLDEVIEWWTNHLENLKESGRVQQ